ncbi:phosphate regulon two-component histidine kinase PhoR [Caenibius tardaugens NBRC 16725]|uniref:histidine kinase n=1 Tax=Caenibius tardaugens NBRC 16725 TaxID=1219035 RepID=U2ZXP2_9SPHN|nr:ATP-binding protein [Caenibius tardaugens]AZI37434.1 two-component sensor histidine kinase [Caenibius tardaugens NBRC 16725]GAD47293.1 phosphate regulon two-component histidine kinase PhoR [Caenibius tardaugens NBRC 16725]
MNKRRPLPWPGIALATVSSIVLLIWGTGLDLVIANFLLWIGSLWISRPEPVIAQPSQDRMVFRRDSMRSLIEHSGLPLIMLDRNRIIVANSAARETLGRHIVGQDARVALRHPDAIALLDEAGGGSATIKGLTGPRSIWHMSRYPVDERYWIIELINRTAEADISRAHTDFVANASHELRTPLSSIIGYVETLVDMADQVDAETAARFHGTVLKEANRLQTLVDDLMSLSRIEAEKHDLPATEIELNGLAAQAARDAGMPDDRARIAVEQCETPLVIRGDRQQLEQLVRNLVDNGLKYGDPEGTVSVTLSRDESGGVVLKVQDQGEGISPEHLPHLTRRFYRTDPGRSQAAGGTGLGLAIVKHIVERHKGRLDIASTPGKGTCITVRFPGLQNDTATLS